MSVRSCFKSYVKTLEYIENTKCKIEELSQDEYREVSHGIVWGDIQLIDGYLFLTPLGMDIIWESYQRKIEIEKKEKSSVVKQNFDPFELERFERESLGLAFWVMFGLILFMCFIVAIASC